MNNNFLHISDYSSDEDMATLDQGYKNKELLYYHFDSKKKSYSEILARSKIQKDERGKIVDKNHQTIPFLTKYEKAKILGIRTKQLNDGSKPFIDITNEILDSYIIWLNFIYLQKFFSRVL